MVLSQDSSTKDKLFKCFDDLWIRLTYKHTDMSGFHHINGSQQIGILQAIMEEPITEHTQEEYQGRQQFVSVLVQARRTPS